MDQTPLQTARINVGGPAKLAELLTALDPDKRISSQAISQWGRVPAERVLDVERVSGVSRHDLRPDLYPREKASAA